ncbi:MAG: DUF29 domain-containing protein [Xenococcaceae cyanobacterium MO_207.B15]|nr:DUF29 domain-containing protein [Xenococcaceae cyanobacterium MO_207.B15]
MEKSLYERDFNLWISETLKSLKTKNMETIDWDNLIEEIEDIGRSQKNALESYLQRLIEHILKLRYWEQEKARCYRGWRSEVVNFRNRIKRIIKKNPSLKNYLTEQYPEIYQDAIATMSQQFDIPSEKMIESEKILEDNYFG